MSEKGFFDSIFDTKDDKGFWGFINKALGSDEEKKQAEEQALAANSRNQAASPNTGSRKILSAEEEARKKKREEMLAAKLAQKGITTNNPTSTSPVPPTKSIQREETTSKSAVSTSGSSSRYSPENDVQAENNNNNNNNSNANTNPFAPKQKQQQSQTAMEKERGGREAEEEEPPRFYPKPSQAKSSNNHAPLSEERNTHTTPHHEVNNNYNSRTEERNEPSSSTTASNETHTSANAGSHGAGASKWKSAREKLGVSDAQTTTSANATANNNTNNKVAAAAVVAGAGGAAAAGAGAGAGAGSSAGGAAANNAANPKLSSALQKKEQLPLPSVDEAIALMSEGQVFTFYFFADALPATASYISSPGLPSKRGPQWEAECAAANKTILSKSIFVFVDFPRDLVQPKKRPGAPDDSPSLFSSDPTTPQSLDHVYFQEHLSNATLYWCEYNPKYAKENQPPPRYKQNDQKFSLMDFADLFAGKKSPTFSSGNSLTKDLPAERCFTASTKEFSLNLFAENESIRDKWLLSFAALLSVGRNLVKKKALPSGLNAKKNQLKSNFNLRKYQVNRMSPRDCLQILRQGSYFNRYYSEESLEDEEKKNAANSSQPNSPSPKHHRILSTSSTKKKSNDPLEQSRRVIHCEEVFVFADFPNDKPYNRDNDNDNEYSASNSNTANSRQGNSRNGANQQGAPPTEEPIDTYGSAIYWCDPLDAPLRPRNPAQAIFFSQLTDICVGKKTNAFASDLPEALCCTVASNVYDVWLDLQADSQEIRDIWIKSIVTILQISRNVASRADMTPSSAGGSARLTSTPKQPDSASTLSPGSGGMTPLHLPAAAPPESPSPLQPTSANYNNNNNNRQNTNNYNNTATAGAPAARKRLHHRTASGGFIVVPDDE